MNKEVKRYDSYGYDGMSGIMKEHADGDWVSAEDYAALEQECDRLRESAGEWGRNCAIAVRERDAALLQVEALREALAKASRAMWASEANMDNEAAEADAALQAKP